MCQQLFLLRHGEVEGRNLILGQRCDVSLSEEGRMQAQAWASALAEVPFQVVVSSTARRAQETAQPFWERGLPALQLPHFQEMGWGRWDGHPYETYKPDLQALQAQWEAGHLEVAAPEGESLRALLNRAQEGLRLLSALYPSGSVLVVTHGQLLRALLCTLFGYPLAEQWTFHHRRGQLSWLVRSAGGGIYLRALAVDADWPF